MSALGDFLHEQRKIARLTLRQLGERAGVSHTYLGEIERGDAEKPSNDVLERIANALPGVHWVTLDALTRGVPLDDAIRLADIHQIMETLQPDAQENLRQYARFLRDSKPKAP